MFDQLLASGPQTKTRKPLTLTISLAVHATVIVALAVIPLLFPKAAELPAIRSWFIQPLIPGHDQRPARPEPLSKYFHRSVHESGGFTTPDEKDAALDGAADGSAVPGRVRVIDDGHTSTITS